MTDWPKELRPPHMYGNFKVKDYSPHKNSGKADQREGMSEKHLRLIKQMPCCVCDPPAPARDPHHLKSGTGERGAALKATDKWTVPMCRPHHDEVERIGSRNELAWFREHGIEDVRELAQALWANKGDLDAMVAVLIAHREHSERRGS